MGTAPCNQGCPVSHHHCLAAIPFHFVSEESVRGVCDSSDWISREDISIANRVCCYISSTVTEGDESHWGCHQQSLFVCAVANRKRGGQGPRGLTNFYRFLHTFLPTKRVTTQRAAATTVHQPPDSRPGANSARPTHSPHTVTNTRSVTAI